MDYFIHKTVGKIVYDFGKGTKLWEPWWCMVLCDKGIMDYYASLSRLTLQKGSAYGAHVSVTRGEVPPKPEMWGLWDGEYVELYYSHNMRMTKWHAWIDVYSDKLNSLRQALGYPLKPQKTLSDGRVLSQSYHLTIGRF